MNADEFNARYPVGTPVFAYPGARPEEFPNATRLVTHTRSRATVLGGHTDVVWVDGHSACIALDHVDVVTEDEWNEARAAEEAAPAVAKPKEAPVDPRDEQIALLERKLASLKAQQEQDDAEYAKAIKQRDRARSALREATEQIAELESDLGEATAHASALQQRLHDAATAKVWTNEDGKKFVFVEDIAPALYGITSGTEAGR